eukprot:scaffold2535_cov126-Cylindrotheca_fusiformis.AAC.5
MAPLTPRTITEGCKSDQQCYKRSGTRNVFSLKRKHNPVSIFHDCCESPNSDMHPDQSSPMLNSYRPSNIGRSKRPRRNAILGNIRLAVCWSPNPYEDSDSEAPLSLDESESQNSNEFLVTAEFEKIAL